MTVTSIRASAKNATEVLNLLKDIPLNSTIFLDIDDTVIAPKSCTFRIKTKDFVEEMKANRDQYPNLDEILSNWRLQRKAILTDEKWPDVIARLKKKYSLYALTAMVPGEVGKISYMERWREEELRGLGVIFTLNEVAQNLKLEKLYSINPLFHCGIIFTGTARKSEALKLYAKALEIKFVALVDDRLDQLADLEEFCLQKEIGFLGINYTGAKELPGLYREDLAAFQKQYLIDHGRWFEDEEAEGIFSARI